MKKNNKQKGQILLIVVLSMIVALTVGLSLVSRTVTNLKISKQSEESSRAFQAAEAGIEQAIKAGNQVTVLSNQLSNNSNFETKISKAQGNSLLLNGGSVVEQDRGIDIWLSDYPDYVNKRDGSLSIYWGEKNQNCTDKTGANVLPALEVLILSEDGGGGLRTLSKSVFDACGRISGAIADVSVQEKKFDQANLFYSIPKPIVFKKGLVAKIVPFYNSAKIGVVSDIVLPAQGTYIESTGKSGDSVRKILFFQSFPQIPTELFQYGILSQ